MEDTATIRDMKMQKEKSSSGNAILTNTEQETMETEELRTKTMKQ